MNQFMKFSVLVPLFFASSVGAQDATVKINAEVPAVGQPTPGPVTKPVEEEKKVDQATVTKVQEDNKAEAKKG